MSAYDTMQAPEQAWPGRVQLIRGSYVVDSRWQVVERGQKWDAYEIDDDDDEPLGGFGAGAATAIEKIRGLIGDPQ